MRKTSHTRGIREDESYSDSVLAWAAEKFPSVDLAGTFDLFADYCRAHGTHYADFDAALRTWVRNGVDKGYGGIVYKQGRAADPKWMRVLAEAKQYGFRAPSAAEPTPESYRTAFEQWKSQQNRAPIPINLTGVLKAVK